MSSGTQASYYWVGVPWTRVLLSSPQDVQAHLQRTTGSTMWTEHEGLYLRSSFHPNLCLIKERQPHHLSARPRRERNPWLIAPHPLHASRGCWAVPDTWLHLRPCSAPTHLPTWALCPSHHACADLWCQTGTVLSHFLAHSQPDTLLGVVLLSFLSLSLSHSLFPFLLFSSLVFSPLSFLPPSFLFFPSLPSLPLSPSFTSHSSPKDPDYHLLSLCWENTKLNT